MVEPYIEALSFIGNNQEILDEIESIRELKKQFSKTSLSTYIEDRMNNIIFKYDLNNKNEEKKSRELQNNPHMIFNNTFTELHTLLGGNKKKNKPLQSAEMNDEKSLDKFKRFEEDDGTALSKLFYGKKRIEKYCSTCKLTQYSYIYQRAFDLNMDDYNRDLDLEDEMKKLITNETTFEFCSMCSQKKKLKVKKTVVELPKIIVIVVRRSPSNNSRINFCEYLFDECYELVGIESTLTIKSNIFSLFFKCFNPPPKKYQYTSSGDIKSKISQLIKEQPYVLYYQRVKKKEKKIKKIMDKIVEKGENNISSNNELIESVHKTEGVTIKKIKKKKNLNNKNKNENENFENKNSQNNNNIINKKKLTKKTNNEKPITLFFTFLNGKELYLDTTESKIFKEILQDIENKYNFKFKISNITYNDIKIDLNKTPSFYNLKEQSYINVIDNIDF